MKKILSLSVSILFLFVLGCGGNFVTTQKSGVLQPHEAEASLSQLNKLYKYSVDHPSAGVPLETQKDILEHTIKPMLDTAQELIDAGDFHEYTKLRDNIIYEFKLLRWKSIIIVKVQPTLCRNWFSNFFDLRCYQ